jgi:hypothetical protein
MYLIISFNVETIGRRAFFARKTIYFIYLGFIEAYVNDTGILSISLALPR